jgi:hypothetical protein
MALTTGDRLNKATVSSIQSRMGVVPAYKPTGIKKATDAKTRKARLKAMVDYANSEKKKGNTYPSDQLEYLSEGGKNGTPLDHTALVRFLVYFEF